MYSVTVTTHCAPFGLRSGHAWTLGSTEEITDSLTHTHINPNTLSLTHTHTHTHTYTHTHTHTYTVYVVYEYTVCTDIPLTGRHSGRQLPRSEQRRVGKE